MAGQASITPRMAKFFKDGEAFIKRSKEAGTDFVTAIHPKMPAWHQWRHYFMTMVGSLPMAFKIAERGDIESFTVPALDPSIFDRNYNPDAPIRPLKPEPGAGRMIRSGDDILRESEARQAALDAKFPGSVVDLEEWHRRKGSQPVPGFRKTRAPLGGIVVPKPEATE